MKSTGWRDGRKDHKTKTEAGGNISNTDSPNHRAPNTKVVIKVLGLGKTAACVVLGAWDRGGSYIYTLYNCQQDPGQIWTSNQLFLTGIIYMTAETGTGKVLNLPNSRWTSTRWVFITYTSQLLIFSTLPDTLFWTSMLVKVLGSSHPQWRQANTLSAGCCTFAIQESADWRGERGGAENHRLKAMGKKQMWASCDEGKRSKKLLKTALITAVADWQPQNGYSNLSFLSSFTVKINI